MTVDGELPADSLRYCSPATVHRQRSGGFLRKLLTFVIVVIALVALVAGYLFLTTPGAGGTAMTYPFTPREQALLGYVPAEAESFALIPAAAATYAKLQANPVTRGPVEEWAAKQSLPSPWMVGGADLAVWKAAGRTSYAIRLDPVRATLVRI
ncbi:MAG: hypothetical protein JWO56_531, partial [Acidobacteria bacterium]|nr:hypothetical protein [Acidobacteriota bacterium]